MIIFDLDGTLLNTAKDLEIALNYALRAHNFPEKTEAETLALLGNGIDALVAGALPQGRQNPDFEPVLPHSKLIIPPTSTITPPHTRALFRCCRNCAGAALKWASFPTNLTKASRHWLQNSSAG